jgi:hypothetical protein
VIEIHIPILKKKLKLLRTENLAVLTRRVGWARLNHDEINQGNHKPRKRTVRRNDCVTCCEIEQAEGQKTQGPAIEPGSASSKHKTYSMN